MKFSSSFIVQESPYSCKSSSKKVIKKIYSSLSNYKTNFSSSNSFNSFIGKRQHRKFIKEMEPITLTKPIASELHNFINLSTKIKSNYPNRGASAKLLRRKPYSMQKENSKPMLNNSFCSLQINNREKNNSNSRE